MALSRGMIYALVFALCSTYCLAQVAGITIRVQQPPVNQYRMSDLWKGEIINHTQTTYRVYLHAVVQEQSLSAPVVNARSAQFDVAPGITMIRGSQVEPFTVDSYNRNYYDVILQSGSMPSGDYRGCTEVVDVSNGEVLATSCNDIVVNRASQPFLVAPVHESVVQDRYPVFTWMSSTPPVGRDAILYRLSIVEIFGTQTPQDAAQRNPAFFDVSELRRTVFMYPVSARAFMAGQRYAWYVRAYERVGQTLQYLGESEVWSFTAEAPFNDGRADSLRHANTPAAMQLHSCPGENWDFETGTYACWVADGDAFDDLPIRDQHPMLGSVHQNRRHWVTTYGLALGNGAKGELRSQEFLLTTDYVHALVGGSQSADACVELLVAKRDGDTLSGPRRRLTGMTGNFVVAGTSHRPSTSSASEQLVPVTWDVRSLRGRPAVVLVRDWSTSAHVNVDAIRFTDEEQGIHGEDNK